MEENQPNNNINDKVPRSDQGHHLSQDILKEIMVRLPVKSLVRFKSVCKEWLNIISILDHPELNFQRCLSMIRIFYQIKKPPRGPYEARTINDEYCSFKLDEKDRGMVAEKKASLHLQNVNGMRDFPVKVACKSLLLFEGRPPGTCRNFTNLYVYDTYRLGQKQLPEIVGLDEKKRFYTMVFDASKRTYLVVVFVNDKIGIGGMKLLLYALNLPQKCCREEGKGEWRESKPPLAQLIGWQQHSSVDVQGVLYWIAQPPEGYHAVSVGNCFIQPMVIATEEFREKIEPPYQPHRISDFYRLLEVNGSLGLLTVKDMARDELYIWVLKDLAESFWIKQHTIAFSSIECNARLLSIRCKSHLLEGGFTNYRHFHPRLIVGSYMLVTMGPYDDLFWYNLDTKELSEVHIRTHPPFTYHPNRRRGTFSIIG